MSNADLAIAGTVLVFAVLGAMAGAARQLAQMAGIVTGYFAARPIGSALGPQLGQALGVPHVVGVVAATVGVFVVVLIAVRLALTPLLRRAFGSAEQPQVADRVLGFVLAGVKASALAWVAVCALVFLEEKVSASGAPFQLSPQESIAFRLAREHNLFERIQFPAVKDLATVAKHRADPKVAGRLSGDPAYQALRTDPRFLQALDSEAMRKAIVTGDHRALLRMNPVLQLVSDPTIAARLAAAAQAGTRPRTEVAGDAGP